MFIFMSLFAAMYRELTGFVRKTFLIFYLQYNTYLSLFLFIIYFIEINMGTILFCLHKYLYIWLCFYL